MTRALTSWGDFKLKTQPLWNKKLCGVPLSTALARAEPSGRARYRAAADGLGSLTQTHEEEAGKGNLIPSFLPRKTKGNLGEKEGQLDTCFLTTPHWAVFPQMGGMRGNADVKLWPNQEGVTIR